MKKEYVCSSCRHNGHTMNEYLDDYDFNFIVDEAEKIFRNDGFEANDIITDDGYDMIEELIREIVKQKACTSFGWKYGQWTNIAVRSIAESIGEEVRKRF